MTSFDDLLRQAAPGDPRICEALMTGYYDYVYRLSLSILADPAEADDAAQETFLQAMLHLHQYQAGTNIKSWLARIAINISRSRQRKSMARQRLQNILQRFTFTHSPAEPSAEEAVIENEGQNHLRKAIDQLDEKHRITVLLRYVHGLTVPEIAEALGMNEGTVQSRLHNAHIKLRGQLARYAEATGRSQEGIAR